VELTQGFPAEPGARLRDARLAGHLERGGGIEQPLQAFQQAAQDLAIRGLHEQRQGDHVVHHHMRR
jgi:hypothetical protein